MGRANIQSPSFTLAALEVRPVAMSGAYFACQQATAPFNMSIDGGPPITVSAGMAFPVDDGFTTLILIDTAGGTTMTLFIGDKGVQYFPPNISTVVTDAKTYTKATGITALADGASSAAFTGLDVNGHQRKAIAVTNQGATTIYVCDGNGNIGTAILAGQSQGLQTSGAVIIKNIVGSGAGSFSADEMFYS